MAGRLAWAKTRPITRPAGVRSGPPLRKAYRIADNRLSGNSAWDDELLGLEFADLEGLGFDLDPTGFDPGELNALVSPTGGHTGEDDAPAAPIAR